MECLLIYQRSKEQGFKEGILCQCGCFLWGHDFREKCFEHEDCKDFVAATNLDYCKWKHEGKVLND
jgi:hypothetical protein